MERGRGKASLELGGSVTLTLLLVCNSSTPSMCKNSKAFGDDPSKSRGLSVSLQINSR